MFVTIQCQIFEQAERLDNLLEKNDGYPEWRLEQIIQAERETRKTLEYDEVLRFAWEFDSRVLNHTAAR